MFKPMTVSLVSLLSLVSAPLAAQASAALAPDPFDQALTARKVADFARRTHDVQAMIVAARMVKELPADPQEATATPPPAFSAAALFDEARTLAKGDQPLLIQIAVAAAKSRGVFASPFGKGLVRSVQDVGARVTYRFDINAVGGQLLRIGAIGDVGTAMGMRLLDAGGRVVCADDRGDYAPVCAASPRGATSYRVELTNRSALKSRTVILSN